MVSYRVFRQDGFDYFPLLLIVPGMVTSPGSPEYPVMVMVPLLVTYSYWACASAAGPKLMARIPSSALVSFINTLVA
jgi:hypothetical protein